MPQHSLSVRTELTRRGGAAYPRICFQNPAGDILRPPVMVTRQTYPAAETERAHSRIALARPPRLVRVGVANPGGWVKLKIKPRQVGCSVQDTLFEDVHIGAQVRDAKSRPQLGACDVAPAEEPVRAPTRVA